MLFAELTLLGKGRRAALIGQKARVAKSTETALGGEPTLARTRKVRQQFTLAVVDHGAHRHLDDDVLAACTVLTLGGAVFSVRGASKRVILESEEGGLVVVGLEPDAAAVSAVSPVRTALGNVGFAAKTDASGPAVASFGVQLGAIDEGRHATILRNGVFARFCDALHDGPLERATTGQG